jgi:hypothetical protein
VALLLVIAWGPPSKPLGYAVSCRYLLNADHRQIESARPVGAWVEHGDPAAGTDEWCEAADEQPVVLGLRHTTSNRLGGRAVDLTGGGAISALLCRSV